MPCGSKRDSELNAQYWIDRLELSRHPEGGYYRATYKADLTIARSALPSTFGGNRAASTAIYFLLEGKDFSAFHRIAADEVWHFYAGNSLVVYVIDAEGNASELHLGVRCQRRFSSGGESRMLVCVAIEGTGGVCACGLHGGAGV